MKYVYVLWFATPPAKDQFDQKQKLIREVAAPCRERGGGDSDRYSVLSKPSQRVLAWTSSGELKAGFKGRFPCLYGRKDMVMLISSSLTPPPVPPAHSKDTLYDSD